MESTLKALGIDKYLSYVPHRGYGSELILTGVIKK